MNREWSLKELYDGFDDPLFKADAQRFDAVCSQIAQSAETMEGKTDAQIARLYLQQNEALKELSDKLIVYASLRQAANAKDVQAASQLGRLMGRYSAVAGPCAVMVKRIAATQDMEALIASDPLFTQYAYLLRMMKSDSRYLLGALQEEIMAKYDISGGDAWANLQSYLTSSVEVDYKGDTVTLSSVRNLAYEPNRSVRKAAYEAELAAYKKIQDPVAFSLNHIKLQVLNECKLRGYASPLDKTLHEARMTRKTLDALLGAMDAYLPVFWKYLRAKANALGHQNGLPWYDLFAPMGNNSKKYTTEEAKAYLVDLFRTFDGQLAQMVERAFDEAWIDFYPRDGKQGGAFCCGIHPLGQSRILTNFDGSFSDVVTLAHELGHAYHNLALQDHRPLNTDYSMPVAETASTFNENIIMNAAIKAASKKEEKLALIESQLSDTTQIICDIYSRYLFETAVFESREEDFLFAGRLCEMMLDTQKKAYGDGLDPNALHPYMWVCKGHYYNSHLSFYNFPYAFGGLFARGLYAKYEQEGDAFVPLYKQMLKATPIHCVEDTARIAGIDLTDRGFWEMSLESFKPLVDEFCSLVR